MWIYTVEYDRGEGLGSDLCGIFSTIELAQAYVATKEEHERERYDVMKYQLDTPDVAVAIWFKPLSEEPSLTDIRGLPKRE